MQCVSEFSELMDSKLASAGAPRNAGLFFLSSCFQYVSAFSTLLFLFANIVCSSPHLLEVRERIRINGQPLDQGKFVRSFWECYNQLSSTKVKKAISSSL